MNRALARSSMRSPPWGLLALAAAFVLSQPCAASPATTGAGARNGAPGAPAQPESARACAGEPMNAAGAVYYACDCQPGADPKCVPGSDSSGGRSPSTPWRTYRKLRSKFSTIRPGDTVAFCRGGRFIDDDPRWVNTSCRAATPCIIRDYTPPWATGAEGRPVLAVEQDRRAMDFSGGPVQGYRVLNIKLYAPLASFNSNDGFAVSGPGTGPSTDITICNVEVEGFKQGIEFYQSAQRLAVVGSRFVNNRHIAILGGSNGTVIRDNDFDHNGSDKPPPANQSHGAVYVSVHYGSDPRTPPGVSDMTISGNRATNNSLVDGVCRGAPMVVHGAVDGLVFENNLIDGRGPNGTRGNGGCFGIMLGPGGYAETTYFRHVAFRRNRLLYTGNVGIATSECSNCVIEDNEIVMGYPGDDNSVTAIKIPFDRKRAGDPDSNGGTVVQNNTIYLEPGTFGTGISIGAEGDRYVVSSNAIYYDGNGSRGFTCFDIDAPATRLAAMDHNLCYAPHAPSASWATRHRTRLEWTATGWDTRSLAIDPLFRRIAEPWDFTPCRAGDAGCPDTSPLVGAADPAHHSRLAIGGPAWTWTAADPGKERDASPDIGAHER